MVSGFWTKSLLSRTRQLLRSFLNCEAEGVSGSVAIEFGLIVPILALMLIAGADLGMGIYRKMQVENSAQAGAEYAIVHGFNATAISSAVTSATSFSGISALPAPKTFCSCPPSPGDVIKDNNTLCSVTCPGGS